MKRSISRDHLQYLIGILAVCGGVALFIYSSFFNPQLHEKIPQAKAVTNTYKSQWVITQTRMVEVYRPTIPARGFSPVRPERVWGQIDVGPAQWTVRTCLGSDFATSGNDQNLGTCPAGSTVINETWTVPPGNWAAPTEENMASVGDGDIPLRARGSNRVRPPQLASEHVRVNESGGEGQGWAFRSALYGVMFSTDDDSVEQNGKGKWWAYSETPLKWFVQGSITTQ